MVKIKATYQGQKHCLALHEPSSSLLETDAPKDNQGLGEKFSPTDLVATALGTCILTTLAIVAERDQVNLVGAEIYVEKVMQNNPRKISSLKTTLLLSHTIPQDYRHKVQLVAEACPVKKSLASDIDTSLEILYTL